jgi:tRNA(Ile)-lysidine synthase
MAPPAVAAVLQKVTATVREHGMVEPGQRVLVACSGGPDSVCLLQSLHRLRRLLRIRLVVFHFDHALRPGSSGDAAYVRRLASRLDLPVVIRRAAAAPEPGRSVEEWARAARYAALDEAAAKVGADVAALGHTLDDQAETVLLGLLRGGGLEAVGGMPPVTSLPPGGFPGVRPLIDTTREETERFCRSLGLRPRRDPTNRDRRFLRNRLRLDVLPLLERRLGRGVRASVARAGDHLRADAEYLGDLAEQAAGETTRIGRGEVRLEVAGLARLPRPLATRVVRRALRLASRGDQPGRDPEAAHVAAVLDLAGGRGGRRVDLPGGLLAVRAGGYLLISRASPETAGHGPHPSPGRRRRASPRGRRDRHGRGPA